LERDESRLASGAYGSPDHGEWFFASRRHFCAGLIACCGWAHEGAGPDRVLEFIRVVGGVGVWRGGILIFTVVRN